jgi:hypothetical protein
MTVALRSPERVSGLIPVDNAPVNAALKSDFPKYVRGMQHVEQAKVSKQSDANNILQEYEEVGSIRVTNSWTSSFAKIAPSLFRFGNSF